MKAVLVGERKYRYQVNINFDQRIPFDETAKKGKYEFFCEDPETAKSFINSQNLKVLGFIFNKYKSEKITI